MNTVDVSAPVLVYGADTYTALGIVRSLGRLGVEVHCADRDPGAVAMRSRYCAGRHALPAEPQPAHATLDALLDVGRRLGGKAVLVPTFDPRSLFVDAHRERFEEHFTLPRPREGSLRALYDKQSLFAICEREGIPMPRTAFPASREEALHAASTMRFPVLLKGIDPDRLMRFSGGLRMALARSADELADWYQRLDEPGVRNLGVQEFIPGTEEDSWIVSAYVDRHSKCRFVMAGQKLRQLPVDGGVTSLAVTRPCEPLAGLVCRLAAASGYHGALDVDLRFDARDGSYHVLDVNPRPGANFRAFVDSNGFDAVRAMYLELTGQALPEVTPVWGRRWISEELDFWAASEQLRSGSLTAGQWLRSLRGVHEYAYLDRGDPGPGLHFLRRFAGSLLGRGARWLRKRLERGADAAARVLLPLVIAEQGGALHHLVML